MDKQLIPIFPHFKEVSLHDRALVKSVTQKYPPYSDFNFTNLWTWDVLESRKFSQLNENLVIMFTDYRTATPILSFLGQNMPTETASVILKHAESLNTKPSLRYIPEETAKLLCPKTFFVAEDATNHDYIFSISELANPEAKKFKTKRRLAKHFITNHPQIQISTRDLSDSLTQKNIFDVLYCWEQNKKIDNKAYEIVYEEIALRRIMSSAVNHELILTCIHDGSVMIAFSIDEILPNNYALSHFIKADIRYKGIYEYLNQTVATILLTSDVRYWNWEQDLNLEGLRNLKMSYRPVSFLKKFEVSLSQ